MFVLATAALQFCTGRAVVALQFYTGRAGEGWVSADASQAFAYASKAEAERKAELFNRNTALHGLTLTVEAAR